jgi:hypothetical protein
MHTLTRKVAANDGRPPSLIREAKLLNGISIQGFWFMLAMALQLSVYFVWGMQYGIPFKPFWSGLFVLMGSSCLVGAIAAKGLAAAGMGDSLSGVRAVPANRRRAPSTRWRSVLGSCSLPSRCPFP